MKIMLTKPLELSLDSLKGPGLTLQKQDIKTLKRPKLLSQYYLKGINQIAHKESENHGHNTLVSIRRVIGIFSRFRVTFP